MGRSKPPPGATDWAARLNAELGKQAVRRQVQKSFHTAPDAVLLE